MKMVITATVEIDLISIALIIIVALLLVWQIRMLEDRLESTIARVNILSEELREIRRKP